MKKRYDYSFLVVDLFCGAGGTTTGFTKLSGKKVKVIACVNHDKNAIKSHWQNHKSVKHFEEDIRTLDLTELTELVNCNRAKISESKTHSVGITRVYQLLQGKRRSSARG
jgi:DNA (cytosine-5)-methyltransferase 1